MPLKPAILPLLCLSVLGSILRADPSSLFDQAAIRDASTLEIEVISDWHIVAGAVATRQKHVTINVGELWPGQDFRIPVRMVVPVDRRASGIHLTGGNRPDRLTKDAVMDPLDQALIRNGVGLVYTVVQEPGSYGEQELGRATEARFAKSLNPRHKIQYWAWPATLMRAVTIAWAETAHFEPGKVAMSGGSKNGASPSMALLHDDRMTAVHATVSPIWDSPLRLFDRLAWDELEDQPGKKSRFSGGHFGPDFSRTALAAGHTWEDLQTFVREISDGVFISRNLTHLRQRKVDLLFHPGSHDIVAYDLAWGGEHHPDIPLYLGANTGHGKRSGHPALERDEQNKIAFLFRHFFPTQTTPLLTAPRVEHRMDDGVLKVSVRFEPDSDEESGQIWWIYDRAPDGSPGYLSELIPDENTAEMIHDPETGSWIAEIKLDPHSSWIDFFSNHRKTIHSGDQTFRTYLSSPYTRVTW